MRGYYFEMEWASDGKKHFPFTSNSLRVFASRWKWSRNCNKCIPYGTRGPKLDPIEIEFCSTSSIFGQESKITSTCEIIFFIIHQEGFSTWLLWLDKFIFESSEFVMQVVLGYFVYKIRCNMLLFKKVGVSSSRECLAWKKLPDFPRLNVVSQMHSAHTFLAINGKLHLNLRGSRSLEV